MVDYSENDLGRASQIISRLLEGALSDEHVEIDLEEFLSIIDLEIDIINFANFYSYCEEYNLDMPVIPLADDGHLPVLLDVFPERVSFSFFDRLRGYRRLSFLFSDEIIPHYIELLSAQKVLEILKQRASEFLATRIAAVRHYREKKEQAADFSLLNLSSRIFGPRTPTPGCNFEVTTDSHGLRVLWSGAYMLNTANNYFGHPTSPVSSVLQSGTYIFGVDGGAYSSIPTWDHAIVSLPGPPSVHLNF